MVHFFSFEAFIPMIAWFVHVVRYLTLSSNLVNLEDDDRLPFAEGNFFPFDIGMKPKFKVREGITVGLIKGELWYGSYLNDGTTSMGDTYDIFSYEDRTSRFFPPPKAPSLPGLAFGVLGSMENQNGTDQEVMNSSQQRLNILCSGDEQGVICFSVFGVFSIGKIVSFPFLRTLPS
eukprot:Gb_34712 [translate_table: standard]